MNRKFTTALIGTLFLGMTTALQAGNSLTKEVLTHVESTQPLFTMDRIEFSAQTGALFSPIGLGPNTPTYNVSQTDLRLGWMLTSPSGKGEWYDGNVEAIAELATGVVFSHYGSFSVGPTGLVRYNFVQPNWKVVPYIQAGAGFVYSDAYENKDQKALGSGLEFTPQAAVGLRYLLNNNWSINAEADFIHTSNAGTASRNLGTNAVGGLLGFSYFFDKVWK